MLSIVIPALQTQLDVIASLQLRMDELCRVCALWVEEQNQGRFLAERAHLLVRSRTNSVMGNKTLGQYRVENNECFYLF